MIVEGSSTAVGQHTTARRDENGISLFEWEGSGRDDTVRVERALTGIGSRTLRIPARRQPYRLNGILDIKHHNMTLKLDAGAVLECDVGKLGPDFRQEDFGSAFRIREKHGFFMIGAGPSSVIRMTGGSHGNAVTLIQSKNGYVGNILLESDQVEAMTDDSFGTGLMSIAYSPNLAELCNSYASKVHVRGFVHYGMQAYGDMASLKILDCDIRNIGDPAQRLSVGAGVAFTRGTKNCLVKGGVISAAKLHGVIHASAGLPAHGVRCEGVDISGCGGWGVHFTEEEQWGTDPGHAGTRNFLIDRNRILRCGGGIRLGTYDADAAIGPLTDGKVTSNIIQDCDQGGILCQSVDVDGKRLERVVIGGNSGSGCEAGGIYVGPECRAIAIKSDNRFFNNGGKDIVDRQRH